MNSVLWDEEFDDYYIGEVDLEMLEAVQKKLNIVLPISYVDLMKKRNGFYLNKKYFPTSTPNSWSNNSVYVDFLYGIGEDPGLLDTIYLRKEWEIRSKKLIIISAQPPIFICLDYRSKKTPSVVFIDVEQNQEMQIAKNFEELIEGVVEHIEEEELTDSDVLSEQEIKEYYIQIDELILKGKPKQIDNLFTRVLSTNNELIRYMVEKMRKHEKPKVHYYLLLFLMCCAEGDNSGVLEDEYLLEVLNELSGSKNAEVNAFAEYSLDKLTKRLNI